MLKELKKKNLVAGCHIMAVHYPKIFPPLLEALSLQPREQIHGTVNSMGLS